MDNPNTMDNLDALRIIDEVSAEEDIDVFFRRLGTKDQVQYLSAGELPPEIPWELAEPDYPIPDEDF